MLPLRIVFLDSWKPASHDGSGTAVGISTLARALRATGHEVRILRPERGAGTLPGRALYNLTLPARLRMEPAPDLVVGFDLDGFRWRNAGNRETPYVVALKGIAADEARFSRSFLERRHLTLLGSLEAKNARSADRVLVTSGYAADVARRAYGIPEDRVRIVPEPIDLAAWEGLEAPDRPGPRSPTILSVARQYPRKDTATLLRALPGVREEVPNVRLRVVGGGPELPRLRHLAGELGITDAVSFHGALPEDEAVRRAYLEADVFCLPSLQEGFGIVFLEAMAAGLPVVAVRAGAVPEVVPEGEAGVLVEPGDFGALAEALVRLLADPETRRTLGAAGRRHVQRYDLEAVAREFLRATIVPDPSVSAEAAVSSPHDHDPIHRRGVP